MTTSKTDSLKLSIGYSKRESNLRQHLSWLEYLTSDQFQQDVKRSYEQAVNRRAIRLAAQAIIESEIYAFNTTDGTGRIKRSFKVVAVKHGLLPEMILYSDPDVAPSKAGASPGEYSYAAYFNNPEFKSFIKAPLDNPLDKIKYRPFFFPMTKAITKLARRRAGDAFNHNIRRKKPRKQA